MPLSPTPAFWVENRAAQIQGLDLLGLRQAAQRFGVEALSGVATVTPAVRYFSLRTWIIDSFRKLQTPNTSDELYRFAEAVEAAFVLGNLLADTKTVGLIGSETARERLSKSGDSISVSKLVGSQIALGIYGGSSDGINLTHNDGGMPVIIEERGTPLAHHVDQLLAGTAFHHLVFSENGLPDQLPRDVLLEFGEAFPVNSIPEAESVLLLNAIIPNAPKVLRHANEIARIGTYAILLHLTSTLNKTPSDAEFFAFIQSANPDCPEEFHYTQRLWSQFSIRDLLAVSHEAILRSVSESLEARRQDGLVEKSGVIGELLNTGELSDTLTSFSIECTPETVADVRYSDLVNWLDQRTIGATARHGILRWDGDLIEEFVIKHIRNHPSMALALTPLIWILVNRRICTDSPKGDLLATELSSDGFDRFGINEVIRPTLKAWSSDNATLPDMVAQLIYKTVDQHLRVVWSRLANDPSKDGSVLIADSAFWSFRKRFVGGRLASRIRQVTGWLNQLGLIGQDGLTEFGDTVLAEARATLMTTLDGSES